MADRKLGRHRIAAALFALAVGAAGAPRDARAYSTDQFSSVTTGEEAQINQVREQEINQLKIVLGRRFAENRRPDILLRLAELYIEKYRFYFFKENQIHQNLYKQGVKERSVNHDRSREQLHSATAACLGILKSRVQFAKLDEVYYFLGYNAEEMGNKKEATKYFEVVATRYPNSAYAPEAYRNLAETAFEKQKYSVALKYYERATQFTKVPSYPRTLYKLAWAYFKMRRKTEALDTMKRVIEVSGKEDKFVGLRDEALGDIVMFFSEGGRFKEAHDYFSNISGGADVYVKALGKLSNVYEHRGDYALAMKVNESLIAEYGDKRPDLILDTLGRNVELYRKRGDGAGEEAALKRLVDFFAKNGSDAARGEDGQATYARTKSYLRGRATQVHEEARKKKSAKLYARAADLYALYIRAFLSKPSNDKEEKERTEIEAYRSDALLASGNEAAAAAELEKTLTGKGDTKMRKEAGTALMNIVIKRLDHARASGKNDAQAEGDFLRVAGEFEQQFPDDKLVIELRYKRARLAASKSGPEGLSGEARDALGELVAKYPSRPEAAEAAHDLVADLMKRKKEDDAVKQAQLYLANGALIGADKKGDLGRYLRAIVDRKAFTEVTREEQGASGAADFAKTAAQYERLAESSKDAEVVSKALNNAAVNYDRAGQTDEAVRVYLKILQKNPASAGPKDELKRLAAQQLWKSRFAEAAKLYSRLSQLDFYSRDERLSSALTAFSLQWGTGDPTNAFLTGSRAWRELCEGGVRKAKRRAAAPTPHSRGGTPARTHGAGGGSADERCHDLALDVARVQLEAGHQQEAVSALKAYLSRSTTGTRRAEANFMLGQIYLQIHEGRKAGMYYEEASRAVSHGKNATRGGDRRERNFAAHAAVLLVEPYFNQVAALKLELPEERLKAVTRKKLSDLESLVTRYTSVVAYGDGEWGIAALERLYDIFSAFAAELDRAPVPSRLQGDQVAAYRRGLQGVSQPMASRAVEYLKQGYQKGLQLGVTTPTYVALTQRPARRSPREYPPAHYSMVTGDEGNRQSALKLSGQVVEADAADLRRPDHSWRAQIAAKLAQNPKSVDTWVEFGNLEALAGRLRLSRLLYEQALSLNPKSAAALCNLSVTLFLDNQPVEATQGFNRAAETAEFSRDIKLNLAKSLLAFHHFGPALDHLRALGGRFPQDREVQEALAVALLGSGQLAQAGTKLQEIDAESGKRFTLWYNWSVWAGLSGDKGQKEKALDLLKDRAAGLGALEKAQADLAYAVFGGAK
ncbi:MAG: tetratricopeptide repeat protein [Deltaproteobacteria bacterium]|nr:tetratricopeptide repeat protein [Deltaproteobacteria bacterium]